MSFYWWAERHVEEDGSAGGGGWPERLKFVRSVWGIRLESVMGCLMVGCLMVDG
jgi:hypothetical protein